MVKISFKATNSNTKLTDFSATKKLVLNNSVKPMPEMTKSKCSGIDCLLSKYF